MSSAPLKFLGAAIVAWIGVRTAGEALALSPLPPIAVPPAAAPLPPEPPVSAAAEPVAPPMGAWSYPPAALQAVAYPYPVAVPMSVPAPAAVHYAAAPYAPDLPMPVAAAAPGLPPLAEWPSSPVAEGPAGDSPQVRRAPSFTPALRKAFDRLSLTSWALLRQNRGMVAPTQGGAPLAPSGQLGQSQAGARLTYQLDRAVALNLRASSPVNQQPGQKPAGEVALGVSWQPLASVPMRVLAERRKAFGLNGGRNAFALLAEGGVYDRLLPWDLRLDGYLQAGAVGFRSPALFADGSLAVSRPVNRRLAIGAGMWGGVQPGLSRLDIGPRASLWLNPRIRAHLDYRLKVIGNAQPGSGPALTVGANF